MFAVFMIILSHAMPNNGRYEFASNIDLSLATTNIQYLIAYLFNNCGQIGNCIFCSASAYFLLESNHVNLKKVYHMIGDVYFITVFMAMIFAVFDKNLTGLYIAKFFVPFASGLNWYVTAYVLLYLLHPALNAIINELSFRKLFIVNAVYIFFYCVIALLLNRDAYYNTRFVGFIGIYFIVGFIKRWKKKEGHAGLGRKMLLWGLAGWLLSAAVLNVLGLAFSVFQGRMFSLDYFMNPFIICIGIGIVLIASGKTFYSRHINYLSGMSLYVYVIHAHRYIIDFGRFYVFDWILMHYSYKYLSLWIGLCAVCVFVISMIVAIIYTAAICKWIHALSDLVGSKVEKILLKLADVI